MAHSGRFLHQVDGIPFALHEGWSYPNCKWLPHCQAEALSLRSPFWMKGTVSPSHYL